MIMNLRIRFFYEDDAEKMFRLSKPSKEHGKHIGTVKDSENRVIGFYDLFNDDE